MSLKVPPRRVRSWLWCGLGIVVLWSAAELVAPRVIAAAYRGESLDILNRVLSGRDEHPLDHYLSLWHRASRIAVFSLIVVLGVVALWRWRISALARPMLKGPPRLRSGDLVWVSAWFGTVAGFAETGPPLVRYLVERDPAYQFAWEAVWMAPPASALAFVLCGLVLSGVARASDPGQRKGSVSIRASVFVLAGLAFYGLLSRSELRLADYATLLLSVGLAAALTRWVMRDTERFLRWMKKSSAPIAVGLVVSTGVGIWTLPSLLEQRRLDALGPAPDGPNVLLIVLDTLRAASMSLYGYERETTPSLDRFAERGVVFDRAIATAPWTLPSHASMFTGRYPHEMSADIGSPLDGSHPTLAEVLSGVGYATAAFVANYFYTTEASGLGRGFARYEDFPIGPAGFLRSSWLMEALVARLGRLGDPRAPKAAETVTDDFLRWLGGRPDRPFFVFLNYMDPHSPYLAPPPYNRKFHVPGQPAKLIRKVEGVTFEQLEGTRSAYDNAIAYTDAQLGRLFRELGRMGILDNTIVVVTSDHGEHLGERGLQGHTNSLYAPVLHVPLMIVYPPGVPSGLRVPEPVTIRDIPRTALELAGSTSGGGLAGSSLSRLWAASDRSRQAPEPLLSEVNYWGVVQDLIKPWDPVYLGDMKSLVAGDFQYIRNGRQEEEVYDMVRDPQALVDLSATLSEKHLLDLRSTLDSMIAGR